MKYRNIIVMAIFFCGFTAFHQISQVQEVYEIDELRVLYSLSDSDEWPAPTLSKDIDQNTFEDIGELPKAEHPDYNPYSREKAVLGKRLFFDPRLSSSGQIACASCHNPELSWTDKVTRSFGHNRQTGKRNAMTLLNVGHAQNLLWDGRANSLEDQVRFPIMDSLEMNQPLNIAVEKIAAINGYRKLFQEAFGEETVTLRHIQFAIATYERTIRSTTSKFDRFISGDSAAFTDQEVLGLHTFRTKAGCINCHNTPYFSDNQFHNDGQTLFGSKHEDFGRYYVTGNLEDIGKFRTPTLREVANTGPWMHHGHFPTMLDVIEYYNLGNPAPIQKRYLNTPRDSLLPQTSPILKKLMLDKEEKEALMAFIQTLSTSPRRVVIPKTLH
ncbi:MAG: cytochrome-c peroxidase [Bacteroidota bacterium]